MKNTGLFTGLVPMLLSLIYTLLPINSLLFAIIIIISCVVTAVSFYKDKNILFFILWLVSALLWILYIFKYFL